MQEHNWVLNFFKNKLTSFENRKTPSSSYPKTRAEGGGEEEESNKQAKNELNEFVANLKSHFLEEEQIVFPLALKANLSS